MYRDGFVRNVPICIGTVVAVFYIWVTAAVALPDTGYSRIHSSSDSYIRIHIRKCTEHQIHQNRHIYLYIHRTPE